MEELKKIVTLSNNYNHWAFQMKQYLQLNGFWEAVVGYEPDVPGPRPEVPECLVVDGAVVNQAAIDKALELVVRHDREVAARAEWEEKDRKAMNIIALSIDRANANLIYHLDSGRAAWIELQNRHQARSTINKLHLKTKLANYKIQSETSMDAHVDGMIEIFNELSDVGEPVQDQVSHLLMSIQDEYPAAHTAMMGWGEDRLTFHEARQFLTQEWAKKKTATDKKKKEEGAKKPKDVALHNGWRKDYILSFLSDCVNANDWIPDSGSTTHISWNKNLFTSLEKKQGMIQVANKQSMAIEGIGNVTVNLKTDEGNDVSLNLKNVLYVPNCAANLLSVRRMTADGSVMCFSDDAVFLKKGERFEKIGGMNGVHYRIGSGKCRANEIRDTEEVTNLADADGKDFCIHEWHQKLGHRNLNDIRYMRKQGLRIRNCTCSDVCEPCIKGKMARKKFPRSRRKLKQPLDLVVSDVCGYMQTESIGKKLYFITFIDVYSRYCEVRFLRQKNEAVQESINFIERMKTQFDRKPKIFRSDRGTEYLDEKLQSYLRSEGIKSQCTVGYCPEQNGVAERKNRTLMEAARTLLNDAELPKKFWAEAVNMANYTTNMIVRRDTEKTPYEMMHGEKPIWNEMRAFGSEGMVMIPKEKRRKLDNKAEKMKFVGYDDQAKGYRMTNGRSVVVSREVTFLDDLKKNEDLAADDDFIDFEESPKKIQESKIQEENEVKRKQNLQEEQQLQEEHNVQEEVADEDEDPEIDNNGTNEDEQFHSAIEDSSDEEEVAPAPTPRRSSRQTKGVLPRKLRDFYVGRDAMAATHQEPDPESYEQAVKSINAENWRDAMQEELKAIDDNETWEVADLPSGRSAIGSRWVFKSKTDENDEVVKWKARLVAKGYSQKHGIDYLDVFAPVARGVTLRTLLSVAGKKKMLVKQYDVKTAFLNGTLQEEIFIDPPQGVEIPSGKVLKLKKSLYGLKQAAHVWNQMINESLVRRGCVQNEVDSCLYIFKFGDDRIFLIMHVDDIIAATTNEDLLDVFMDDLGKDFQLKCIGEAKEYLGIKMDRDVDGNFLVSQEKFIDTIVRAAGMDNGKASFHPLDPGYLKLEGKELTSNTEYRRIIGMVLYLSTNTRPDIAATVAMLSKRVSKPRDVDWNELKRLVSYLSCTRSLKLKMSDTNINNDKMITMCDADFAEDREDRKSNSGYIIQLNGGTISWSCRKQDIVTLSTTEAEYVAMTEAVKEALWVRSAMKELCDQGNGPLTVFCDNQSAIAMTDKQNFSNKTKHVDVKFHFVRDMVKKEELELKYIATDVNIADLMTKPLGRVKMEQLRELAGLTEASEDSVQPRRSVEN
jgi:hypothetical protein